MTTTRTILAKTCETRRKKYIARYPAIALGLDTEADSVCSLIVPISGAPSEVELLFPEKTIYVNRDGDASTTIYVNIAGVAVALPLSGGAGSFAGLTATGTSTLTKLKAAAVTELTIASGIITVTQTSHTVDTESDGASDDLVTISGGSGEQLLVLRPASDARSVVLKHASGNIQCPGGVDITLAEDDDMAVLWWNGTSWTVIAYKSLSNSTTFAALVATTADINGGTVDNAAIGATTPAAGTFTTLAATTVLTDEVVKAAIAVADAPGGLTTAALTVALTRANGSTAIASARQVMIKTGAAQYASQALNGTTTFGSATVGSIIASGTGWALIETTAGGLFACTATNSADEGVYFWCESSFRASDLTKAATVIGSNSDLATWAA